MTMDPENGRAEPDAMDGARGTALASPSASPPARERGLRHRVLHIRITDMDTGRLKVGLSLPVSLVSVAMRLGARLVPPGHDAAKLVAVAERGDHAGPVIVDDEGNRERVEISLEE